MLPHEPGALVFRQKVFWFRPGYDWQAEREPRLAVAATRLDAPASSVVASRVTGAYREQDWKSFMVSLIDIPTSGCWKITGRYEHDELSFVVRVAP
jgi:hypothetical protein